MSENTAPRSLLVVGGGAAGCFAAVHAARRGVRVTVLDGNSRLMHKLSLTGKGRCNLTNNCDSETLLANVIRNPRFLYSAFSRCTPQDVMQFFESAGIPLKTERGRRVFPQSDRAGDIVSALSRSMQLSGVQIRTGTRVQRLIIEENTCRGVIADGQEFRADAVLLCTGGMSYPRTGSRGDGYALAKQAGHTVSEPEPSLIPIETAGTDAQEMQGLSLKNVTLTVKSGKKQLFSEQGEMLFTHFGVSGPLVLSASAVMSAAVLPECLLQIDLKPALDAAQLDRRIQRDFAEWQNKDAANILRKLLPASMIPVILRRAGIPPAQKVHEITRGARQKLAEACKQFTLQPVRFRPVSEAVITRGGVSVREIDPNTMESKRVKGLFFAGELIDVDARTGGYNLQIAFATAYSAALAVSADS